MPSRLWAGLPIGLARWYLSAMAQRISFLTTALCSLLGLGCQAQDRVPPASPEPGASACQPADCGPLAKIARICDDGSTGATECTRAQGGACRWEHVCPGEKSPAGPAPTGPIPQPTQPPGQEPPGEQPRPSQPAAQQPGAGFADANAAFAQRLYGKLAATTGKLFFSPASVSTALAMTYAGARGETAAQMAKALEFTLPPEALHPAFGGLVKQLTQAAGPRAPELRIANRLWGQAGLPIEPAFQSTTQQHYGAGIELVDFKGASEPARGRINQWVEQQTNAKIKDLMPAGSITPLTRLVLTNAIYFKGKWATPFDKQATRNEPFTVKPGTAPAVPMMRKTLQARFGQAADASVLELAYEAQDPGRPLAMVVILPAQVDGLAQVEQRLSAGQLKGYVEALRPTRVDVALPRFKMTAEFELSKTLAELGMPLAFDERKADFSGITRAEPLFISQVRHKAFVEVNEEGTEAAAATGVVVSTRAAPAPPPVFRADRPFAFLIRDVATGAVLFMGRVTDPR
ncbi:serpin family protein [Sorangium sp. So ce260]|uniref:serpin family protein n=1 Tax=Sorangium sp. So ce260 TaxID=3133291 RepID=UPI003F5E8AAD